MWKWILTVSMALGSLPSLADVQYFQGKMMATQDAKAQKQVPVEFVYEREIIPAENKVIETCHSLFEGRIDFTRFVYDHHNKRVAVLDLKGKEMGSGTFECQGQKLEALSSCTYKIKTNEYDIVGTDHYSADRSIRYDSKTTFHNGRSPLVTKGTATRLPEKTFREKLAALVDHLKTMKAE